MQDYYLWLGAVVSEQVMLTSPAVSPAANRWQAGLLGGLRTCGWRVLALGYLPEPAWPRGRFLVGENTDPQQSVSQASLVGYSNLPWLRDLSAGRALCRAIDRLAGRIGRPAAILSYNAGPAYVQAGKFAQKTLGIPWVPLVADVPTKRWERQLHEKNLTHASGTVFLSWGSYCASTASVKLHLDGGVEGLRSPPFRQASRKPALLFSGSMSPYAGISFLLDAFARIPGYEVELWICGKGANEAVARSARRDPRIKVFGAVSERKLEELSLAASVFVNPRPSTGNENNFPSKVLEYLSFGKPVVSTWTAGLSPEYQDVLIVPDRETPEDLALAIRRALALGEGEVDAIRLRSAEFLSTHKLWSVQARRFVGWLSGSLGTTAGRIGDQE